MDIVLPGADRQLEDRLLDRLRPGAQGQGGAEGHHHRTQPALLAALAQPGGGIGEEAAPEPTQVKGHDDRLPVRGHLARRELEAALELGELAVLADGALGEDADHLALLQQPRQEGDGVAAAAAGDGHHLEEVQEPFEVPAGVDLPFHDEAHRPRAGHLHQGPVQPTDVVAQEHDPAGGRQVVQADDLEAEAGRHQPLDEEADQGLGQLIEGVSRPDQGDQGQAQDQGLVPQFQGGGGDGDAEEGQHPQVLDEVVGRQHPSQGLFAGVELDQGVEGHQDEAAEDADEEKVEAVGPGRVQPRHQEEGDGDAHRPQRDEGGLDVITRYPPGDDGAEDDAQTRAGEDALDHHRVGLPQAVLGEGREDRQDHLGDGPEDGQADDRQPDDAVVPGRQQVVAQVGPAPVADPVEGQGPAGVGLGQPVGEQGLHQGGQGQQPPQGGDEVHHLPRRGVDRFAQVALEQHREKEDAEEDGRGGGGLDPAVGRRQGLVAHQFLDVAVLGRGVDGALGGEEEGHGEGRPEPAQVVTEGDGQGDGHRRPGRQAHDPGFGEAVGQVARGGEQQDEGQQDQGVDDGGEQDLGIAVIGLEQGVLDDDLVAQVDEGIEKHHADEGQEAADAKEEPHGPLLRDKGWAQRRMRVPGRDAASTIPNPRPKSAAGGPPGGRSGR